MSTTQTELVLYRNGEPIVCSPASEGIQLPRHGVCLCVLGCICHKMCTQVFYEFVKSLKRLISSSRCNRLAVLVNTMGGQWLTTTVHIVIYWLLFVFYTVKKIQSTICRYRLIYIYQWRETRFYIFKNIKKALHTCKWLEYTSSMFFFSELKSIDLLC